MIHSVVKAAERAGVDVSLCGEMAANPRWTSLLLGLGLRRLSMSPRSIARIKERIRGLRVEPQAELAQRCLQAALASEVDQLLQQSGDA